MCIMRFIQPICFFLLRKNRMNEYGMTDSRAEYLWDLADDYGVAPETVFRLANMLGESEDYDGLVSAVNELSEMGY
jgi:hypothetical protein